jgi:NADPH:quinone reductase-like Zn-dependent oxidoreductase
MWQAAGAVTGLVSGLVTRKLLNSGWRRLKGSDPPTNPASPRTRWSEALMWAAASGVAIAVARLVAARGAAEAWRATTGHYPEGLESVGP